MINCVKECDPRIPTVRQAWTKYAFVKWTNMNNTDNTSKSNVIRLNKWQQESFIFIKSKTTNHRQQRQNVVFYFFLLHWTQMHLVSILFEQVSSFYSLCLHLKKQAVNVVATEFDTIPTRCDIEKRFFFTFWYGNERLKKGGLSTEDEKKNQQFLTHIETFSTELLYLMTLVSCAAKEKTTTDNDLFKCFTFTVCDFIQSMAFSSQRTAQYQNIISKVEWKNS